MAAIWCRSQCDNSSIVGNQGVICLKAVISWRAIKNQIVKLFYEILSPFLSADGPGPWTRKTV